MPRVPVDALAEPARSNQNAIVHPVLDGAHGNAQDLGYVLTSQGPEFDGHGSCSQEEDAMSSVRFYPKHGS